MSAQVYPAPISHTHHLQHPPLSSTISFSKMPPAQSRTTTLKRKRPAQPQISYRSEQHVDATGALREVIVIDDSPTPPPHPPAQRNNQQFAPPVSLTPSTHSASAAVSSAYSNGVRTRAQAAAEATGASRSAAAPAVKRRKKETGPVASTSSSNIRAQPTSGGSALARKAIASRAAPVVWGSTAGVGGTASSLREASAPLSNITSRIGIPNLKFSI